MKKALICIGMAYGDESKGQTVEYLARRHGASLVVRHGGGSQAAHNVVQKDGRHHTFSQFGSGSFIPGVKTHLSRFMLINPITQMAEEVHLNSLGITDMWERTTVDWNCVIITPIHRAYNRILEMARGEKRHGSCGVGVGVARWASINYPESVLRARHLSSERDMAAHLSFTRNLFRNLLEADACAFAAIEDQESVREEMAWILDADRIDWMMNEYSRWPARVVPVFHQEECMIFEGAQGVLLDEKHGSVPHNTWTNTTFDNALEMLSWRGSFDGEVKKIGCFRTYFTRHGAGPFPTELHYSADLQFAEKHNRKGKFQGGWRVGKFDMDMANYAVKVCGGVDEIAMSHFDISAPSNDFLSSELAEKVTIIADGPTSEHRKEVGGCRIGTSVSMRTNVA